MKNLFRKHYDLAMTFLVWAMFVSMSPWIDVPKFIVHGSLWGILR